ncbi:MAG: helix-turn-helix transcriptional regulator [Proteobacteria bacterium]|nr:helix-turn-helix transcriptional regulator [Pseudomonadota bacterium]
MDPIDPLLALLGRRPAHGYALKAWIDRHLDPFWQLDFGQLYRVLRRAAADGLVAVARREASPRGPSRIVYRLTADGRRRLAAWLAEPARSDDELMVKLAFAAGSGSRLRRVAQVNRDAVSARSEVARRTRGEADARADPAARFAGEARRRRSDATEASFAAAHGLVLAGSDDPMLAQLLAQLGAEVGLPARMLGSFGGLWALQRGEADIAALHLCDVDGDEYNVPYLRRLLPEGDWVLVNVAWRENGLIVAHGNPRGVRGVADLVRGDLRFVNRTSETGTRLLLLRSLRQAGIAAAAVAGWEHAVATHADVARTVASGATDVGPGLRAAARAAGLDFIPLAFERYDIAFSRRAFESKAGGRLVGELRRLASRRRGAGFAGYDLRECGRIVAASDLCGGLR